MFRLRFRSLPVRTDRRKPAEVHITEHLRFLPNVVSCSLHSQHFGGYHSRRLGVCRRCGNRCIRHYSSGVIPNCSADDAVLDLCCNRRCRQDQHKKMLARSRILSPNSRSRPNNSTGDSRGAMLLPIKEGSPAITRRHIRSLWTRENQVGRRYAYG